MDQSDPAENAQKISAELEKYSPKLAEKPRWLVFNKVDLLLEEEADELIKDIVARLEWEGPVYQMSAFQKLNTDTLCSDIMSFIESLPPPEEQEVKQDEEVGFKWNTYHDKAMEEADDDLDDDDWDDDDYDVEVEYRR